jgi:hypothetical protein
MTPQERLEVIRRCLKRPACVPPKPSGLNRAANPHLPVPKVRRAYVPKLGVPCYSYAVYGDFIPTSPNRKEWVGEPDKREPKPCAPKRVKRVSALTRISQQLPMKLAKLPANHRPQEDNASS